MKIQTKASETFYNFWKINFPNKRYCTELMGFPATSLDVFNNLPPGEGGLFLDQFFNCVLSDFWFKNNFLQNFIWQLKEKNRNPAHWPVYVKVLLLITLSPESIADNTCIGKARRIGKLLHEFPYMFLFLVKHFLYKKDVIPRHHLQ